MKNRLVTGRASTALYLIFANLKKKNGSILVPANICHMAVWPVLMAGYRPCFCDVDIHTGNLTHEDVKLKLESEFDCVAMIVPHMYGNTCADIGRIKELCANRDIILVEDCASILVDGINIGVNGDYVISSTGYAKPIELGFGGVVESNEDLSDLEQCLNDLPEIWDSYEFDEEFLSKLYRFLRNNYNGDYFCNVWTGIRPNIESLISIRLAQDKIDLVNEAFNNRNRIEKIRKRRWSAYRLYQDLIKENAKVRKYYYSESAVPWRYNLFVDEDIRAELVTYLLEHNVPVSDWYPCVTEVFGESADNYPNAVQMDKTIINFPLNIEDEEVVRITNILNEFLEGISK